MEKDKLKEILLQRKLELNHNYDKNLLNLNLALLGFLSITFLTDHLISHYLNANNCILFLIIFNFICPMTSIALIQFIILKNDQKIIDSILENKLDNGEKLESHGKKIMILANTLFFISILLTIVNIILVKGDVMKNENKINTESLDNLTKIYKKNIQIQVGETSINVKENYKDNNSNNKK